MDIGYYKLAKQINGLFHYAEVHLEKVDVFTLPMVQVAKGAFAWLKDDYGPDAWEWAICDDYRQGAIQGVQYALDNVGKGMAFQKVGILITTIKSHPAHGTVYSVAFAACMATWTLLEVDGISHPYFQGEKLVFPSLP
ncbi:hypothetical protein [Acaryochloris marina]|uniref:Uncharacterized protein n=1 Tax=Acaryochloris marina (strain MBIC 11017) TaxID=329726 RepID=B0C0Q3_ACAM1|nr:hypothetical protein [Acaryochloris marina]ABW26027.1 hypothetical protein AM1_0985 [Acaryochloris marina MBIC11017]BDM80875.1 hypothetical protein AM10699_37420 [Acaryochloris marina MBIC10699]